MMFHGDFPSFSPKENMQGHSFEVASNHSSQLHGSRVHFVSPSLNLCICNRIAMTFKDNKNWWKDCLAMSAEAHASLLVKATLPSKHSICGYNIKGARSCHFHVNLTRASETILMQTSSSLGNPLQGQTIDSFLESGINFYWCTNLLYCKQNTTVNAFKRVTCSRHKHPNMQHLTQLYHVLNITSHSITHSSPPSKLPYAWLRYSQWRPSKGPIVSLSFAHGNGGRWKLAEIGERFLTCGCLKTMDP